MFFATSELAYNCLAKLVSKAKQISLLGWYSKFFYFWSSFDLIQNYFIFFLFLRGNPQTMIYAIQVT